MATDGTWCNLETDTLRCIANQLQYNRRPSNRTRVTSSDKMRAGYVLENAVKEIFRQLDPQGISLKSGGAYHDAERDKVSKPDLNSTRPDLFYPEKTIFGIEQIIVQGDQGNFIEVKSGKEVSLESNTKQIRAFINQVKKLGHGPEGPSTEHILAFITCTDTRLADDIFYYALDKKVLILQYTCEYRIIRPNRREAYEIRLQEPFTKELIHFPVPHILYPSALQIIRKPLRSISSEYTAQLQPLKRTVSTPADPDPDEYTGKGDLLSCISQIEACHHTDKKNFISDLQELGLQEKAQEKDRQELLKKIEALSEFRADLNSLKLSLKNIEYQLKNELDKLLTNAELDLLDFKIEELKTPPSNSILLDLIHLALALAPYLKLPSTLIKIISVAGSLLETVGAITNQEKQVLIPHTQNIPSLLKAYTDTSVQAQPELQP